MNNKVNIRSWTEGNIIHIKHEIFDQVRHWSIDTTEAQLRKGLKALGWLSPEEAEELREKLDWAIRNWP